MQIDQFCIRNAINQMWNGTAGAFLDLYFARLKSQMLTGSTFFTQMAAVIAQRKTPCHVFASGQKYTLLSFKLSFIFPNVWRSPLMCFFFPSSAKSFLHSFSPIVCCCALGELALGATPLPGLHLWLLCQGQHCLSPAQMQTCQLLDRYRKSRGTPAWRLRLRKHHRPLV